MRHLYALIVATGLCVPALALAKAPDNGGTLPAASAAAKGTNTVDQRPRDASQVTSQRPSSTADDKARYAEKEAKSGEAQNYRGGDTIVIGASAATAILAVLLLIILI